MKTIEIIKPDDWHVHFRDNHLMETVVPETSRYFARALVMPNLIPPILTGQDAIKYKDKIKNSIPIKDNFNPLMTIYLTEKTDKDDVKLSFQNGLIFGAKLYPAGATTNSELGVKNIKKIMPILEIMEKIGMPLLIHGEVVNHDVDIFDREKVFIETVLDPICKSLPNLKITLEHITTKDAVKYIENSKKNLGASITPHHIALNRNDMLSGGIKPHYYCLPILKREIHRIALLKAATSGNKKFFLGTDSAPHFKDAKESACGCAGVFNATYCIQILTQIFEQENCLDNLERFVSINGATHYGQKINNQKITLLKKDLPIILNPNIVSRDQNLINFIPNFPLFWDINNS